ncbi:unnamed protein product [Mytilus coruscus]|uniref:B box-type domain-containing protein n=1 Tax=Mytilus coruscus TaxID=42192 RepID=A0A6J8CWP7_MYTCO|nr:unnamed protein product [Mytilus coruscus]
MIDFKCHKRHKIEGERGRKVLCDKHHDTSLEYFCTKHEKLCCILCKRQYQDCCNVKKVDYVADDSKLETTTENLLSEIKERKDGFIEAADNARLHLRDLEITNNKCKEELKNTRLAIDDHLDLFQNEVEQEINKKYENNRGELIKQVTDITAEIKYITDKQKIY